TTPRSRSKRCRPATSWRPSTTRSSRSRSSAGAATGPTRSSRHSSHTIDPRLALAHRLASRSDADLWDGAATFLVVLDANRSDRALWMGFARLARMAIERDGVDATRLAQRLLRSAEAATLPEFVVPLLGPLRERAR